MESNIIDEATTWSWVTLLVSQCDYVLAPEYDTVYDFENGLGRIRLDVGDDRKYGYVDGAGAFVWYPTN